MQFKYLPVSLTVSDSDCLVVGGGLIALRKIENLIDYSVKITVVAKEPHRKIKFFAEKGRLNLEEREYKSPEANAYSLVISATDDQALNERVYNDAHEGGALVNVVDNPPLCDFIFPALVRRGPLTTAISTDGKAPFLSGHLKAILEGVFPDHWHRIAKLAVKFRADVQKRWPDDGVKRADCFAAFLASDWKGMLKEMNDSELEEDLKKIIEDPPRPDFDNKS